MKTQLGTTDFTRLGAHATGLLRAAEAQASDIVERATRREWGGYSGYAADPDGYRWEIANAGDGPLTALVVPNVTC